MEGMVRLLIYTYILFVHVQYMHSRLTNIPLCVVCMCIYMGGDGGTNAATHNFLLHIVRPPSAFFPLVFCIFFYVLFRSFAVIHFFPFNSILSSRVNSVRVDLLYIIYAHTNIIDTILHPK